MVELKNSVRLIMAKQLISFLKKPKKLEDIVSEFNVSEKDALENIKLLKRKGYEIVKRGEYYFFNPEPKTARQFYEIALPKKVKFAVVSDTHIGSKQSRLDLLQDFYKQAEKEGVKFFLHVGDVIDGVNVYQGQVGNLEDFTIEAQVQKVIEEYPVSKVKTYFTCGNHDLKEYAKGYSIHIGKAISSKRKDLIWTGDYDVRYVSKNYGIVIEAIHPTGASAYAVSYKPQKLVESMPSGNKPNILLIGHYHDAIYMFYRNIHILKTGSFQDENEFSLRKGMINTLGGWIVELEHNGFEVTKFKPYFMQYYK